MTRQFSESPKPSGIPTSPSNPTPNYQFAQDFPPTPERYYDPAPHIPLAPEPPNLFCRPDVSLPIDTRPLRWLWPDRLPFGHLTLLEGDHHAGLSLLAFSLAASVLAGLTLPGAPADSTPAEPGFVLFITPFAHPLDTHILRTPVHDHPSSPHATHRLIIEQTSPSLCYRRPPSFPCDLDHLAQQIQVWHPSLVILDPFLSLIGTHATHPKLPSMPLNTLAYTLAALHDLAQEHHCAILLCRSITTRPSDLEHPRLLAPRALDILSHGLLAVPDPHHPNQFLLRTHRTHTPSHAPLLCYRIDTDEQGQPTLQWLDPPADYQLPARSLTTRPLSTQRQAILRYLHSASEPQAPYQVANATGFRSDATRQLLLSMSTDKQVHHTAPGLYTTPNHPCLLTINPPPDPPTPTPLDQIFAAFTPKSRSHHTTHRRRRSATASTHALPPCPPDHPAIPSDDQPGIAPIVESATNHIDHIDHTTPIVVSATDHIDHTQPITAPVNQPDAAPMPETNTNHNDHTSNPAEPGEHTLQNIPLHISTDPITAPDPITPIPSIQEHSNDPTDQQSHPTHPLRNTLLGLLWLILQLSTLSHPSQPTQTIQGQLIPRLPLTQQYVTLPSNNLFHLPLGRRRLVLRKDRVLEALQSLCAQRPAQRSALRRDTGFSADEVAEYTGIDRTNASRDLNILAQEGKINRIPGRPVLFATLPSILNSPNTRHKNGSNAQAIDSLSTHIANTQTGPAQLQVTHQPGKPPAVAATVHRGAIVTSFETLIGGNDGLKVAVQQAKAAMLYPPRGLHTLLCGPSGVGKTTFARLMHTFALEQAALSPDAPFTSFNCADYAGNPQLLMAHLFGVMRGAYTDADRDREGLVEQSHHGILFLDEVHRLPPEGQEMLFHLMDRERFRRLGDPKERHASVLLLAATTEDPKLSLLPTFRRRIPMTISLPGLHERTIMERYELLRAFFTTECSGIGVNISVTPQVLRAFLLYECPGNIGQLRTDVQLVCAHAYLEYRTSNLPDLNIHPGILPDHVRRGLLHTAEINRALAPVAHLLDTSHIFTPTGLSLDIVPESAQDLYLTISNDLSALRDSGLADTEINRLLHLDIQRHFQRFADTLSLGQPGAISNLVDEHLAALSHRIVQYAEAQLGRVFPEKLTLVLALHLSSALQNSAQHSTMSTSGLPSVRYTYPIEYEIARVALLQIRSTVGVSLPESEADVLTILLANADTLLSGEQSTVGIVVAAHGRNIASGLAELANTLVGGTSVHWVELTLEQSPEELLAQVVHWTRAADQGSGVLLLVDFASLLSLEELVTRQSGVKVRTVSGVNAPLLVEAVRRAQRSQHITLDQLAGNLSIFHPINERGQHSTQAAQTHTIPAPSTGEHTTIRPARVILSVCLTGFGSATKIAELIASHLPDLHQQGIEIVCMDINLSSMTEADIQRLVGKREVVAIVGTINPHIARYPFISLTDFLFADGVARLRALLGSTLIDPALLQPSPDPQDIPTVKVAVTTSPEELLQPSPDAQDVSSLQEYSLPINKTSVALTSRAALVNEITHTLSQRLLFLNPTRAMPLIDAMIALIEVETDETFDIDVLAGLMLHLACILERGLQHDIPLVSEPVRRQIEHQFPRELSICRRALHILSGQIARSLPDAEAYNIVGILRQVDIFLDQYTPLL